ncbi:MAG: DUF1761 domain-containing protein [Gammaproteobacteria bacterium]
MQDINLFATVVAAASSFLLGGLWYSKLLFEKAWVRESGAPEQPGHPAMVFGLSFLFSLIAAVAFAVYLGPAPELARAVTSGFVVGLCFVATSFGINYQFANRGFLLLAIDGGYHIGQFVLFGVVLGLWH